MKSFIAERIISIFVNSYIYELGIIWKALFCICFVSLHFFFLFGT